jgi:uncharacterized C2H2 Zn-finger protein
MPLALLGLSAIAGIGSAWGGTLYGIGLLALAAQTQPMRRVFLVRRATVVVRLSWMAYLAYFASRFIRLDGERGIGGQVSASVRFGSSHVFASYLVAAIVLLSITEFLLLPGKWPFESGMVRHFLDFQPASLSSSGSRRLRFLVFVAAWIAAALGFIRAFLPVYPFQKRATNGYVIHYTPATLSADETARLRAEGWLGVLCLISAGLLLRVVTAERCARCGRLVESTKDVLTGRTTPAKDVTHRQHPTLDQFGNAVTVIQVATEEFVRAFRCPRCDYQWRGSRTYWRERDQRPTSVAL